jgi:molecular chaperone GrpE
MSEIDKILDTAPAADSASEPSPPDEPEPSLGDELDLEVLEGLAGEEEREDEASPLAFTRDMSADLSGAAIDYGREGARGGQADLLLAAIKGIEEHLGRRLESLQTTFERELRAESTRERVVDRLHAELQEYKQDFLLKVQRPIFIDLIQLHDDIGKMIDARTSSEAGSDQVTEIRRMLEPIRTAIEDILYRQGVEPFTLAGVEFDPRKQRAVSTQTTDDPALNKSVAARLRPGFSSGEKLIRPEIVSVFTYRPMPAQTEG